MFLKYWNGNTYKCNPDTLFEWILIWLRPSFTHFPIIQHYQTWKLIWCWIFLSCLRSETLTVPLVYIAPLSKTTIIIMFLGSRQLWTWRILYNRLSVPPESTKWKHYFICRCAKMHEVWQWKKENYFKYFLE